MSEILVGVDSSDHSRRAVEFALARAAERQGAVVLIHVIPWSPFSFNTASENEHRHAQKEAEIKAATEQITEPLAELAKEAGVPCETIVIHGDPVEQILKLAEKRQSNHIAVGRVGDSRIRRALFGSTPGHLVQQAPVPVTVVP